RTYEIIENIFKSLSKEFSSRRVHIGMDEAHKVGLGKYLDIHGYQNRYELLMRHLNKVCDIAKKYGFEPMMWDDMFFRIISRGRYEPVESFPPEIQNNVPDNVSLVYWDYYHEEYEDYIKMIESTKKLSEKIWFAGGAWCWGSFTPHNRVSMRRNEQAIKACADSGIRNVILTMWGDNGGECPYYDVLPALMHAAAVAEGLDEKEMKAKFKKITGDDFDAFKDLDLPNYILGEDKVMNTVAYSKNRFYNDPFLGLLDLNVEGADEKLFAKYRARLAKDAKNSKNFGYVYDVQAKLCSVLEIKFSLGIRTRELYEKGDKEGLKALALTDYTKCIGRVKKFYEAFRVQWYTCNKPFGFEVQDARFGGMILRLENCRRVLIDYADGKIKTIPELDEKQLPNDGPRSNFWSKLVTACPI
ncbi:MAG: family 20 glycosylhydrolase, partial [Clostridiales bacterium]|nr:family 20 glycosylhydrolase [Clostridiales bacterium]